jgi:hypothetical protein
VYAEPEEADHEHMHYVKEKGIEGGENRLVDRGRRAERYGQVLKAIFVEYEELTRWPPKIYYYWLRPCEYFANRNSKIFCQQELQSLKINRY